MLKREHKVALFVVFAVEAVEFTLLGKLERKRNGGGDLVYTPLAAMFSPAEAVSLNVISTPEQLSEDTVTRLSLYKP